MKQAAKSPSRTKLIALIHVAKKQLAISDENYRAMLMGATGKDSLREMSDANLESVIARLKKFGFKKQPPKRAGTQKKANSEQSRLIRALWVSLYHLGEVRDPSEEALTKYVQRMAKIDALQWITAKQADIVIAGLREWMKRAGFVRPTNDDFNHFGYINANNHDNLHDDEALINAAHVLMAQAKISFKTIAEYRIWLVENGITDNEHPYAFSLEETYALIEKLAKRIRKSKGYHD